MLTVSSRYEMQTANRTSGSQALSEQFNDLMLKYDVLEHKYNTMKLENEEYKKLIEDLQQQNEELIQDSINYKNTLNNESHLIPIFSNHISTIQTELNDDEEQIVELNDKLNEYRQINKSLESENTMLKNENNLVRNILQKQKTQMSKRVNNDNNRLLNENQLLRDELSTANEIITSNRDLFACKEPSDSPSDTPSPKLHHSEKTIHFNLNENSPTVTDQSNSQRYIKSRKATVGSVAFFNPEFMNSVLNNEEPNYLIDELSQKIDKLEMENNGLLQQLSEYEERYDVEVENDNENNEIQDMEELFKKCEYEILNHLNDNLIEKFRILGFEIQLRRVY